MSFDREGVFVFLEGSFVIWFVVLQQVMCLQVRDSFESNVTTRFGCSRKLRFCRSASSSASRGIWYEVG